MPNNNICRVCGLEYEMFSPWGENNNTPSFEICDCCGTEFGYEDATLESIKKQRQAWIKNGAQWFSPEKKARDWSLEKSLSNIPMKYK